MKLSKKFIIIVSALISGVFLLFANFLVVKLLFSNVGQEKAHYFSVSQKCGGYDYWSYSLSSDGILREVSYKESTIFSDKTQTWRFQIIGDGIITITWELHLDGNEATEQDSYMAAYQIDKAGNYTQIPVC